MKQQYLGDAKDSFKWDYHDYLTSALRYPVLNIMLMLTPDDDSRDGETRPELFPARQPVIEFCCDLRKQRDVQLIQRLPITTGAAYRIKLHKGEAYLTNNNRAEYFSDLTTENSQVLFLDPDNGFEPEKSSNEKHVLYSDIHAILEQVSEEAVISVFQHFRRIPFGKDFARIRERLTNGYATAIYWHSLMFVIIGRTKETIKEVMAINHQYSQVYPVKIL